jgi:hypothetical protein
MSLLALQASLALWRRRSRYRDAKALAAHKAKNAAAIHKWGTLLAQAVTRIHLREQQISKVKPAAKVYWIPGAIHRPLASAGPYVSGFQPKMLWHTTQGSSDATSTLEANDDPPQLELLPTGQIIQYMPINLSGRALQHVGTPETNRGNVVQCEVVGFAAHPSWPAAQVQGAIKIARFVEANNGVERASHVKFHPSDGVRLSGPAWVALKGHCGHMHVPENSHVDPGAIDSSGVLATILH